MKILTSALVLIASLLSTHSAIANEQQRYWFYQTAVEAAVKSGYTVRLNDDKSNCEGSAVVVSLEDKTEKQKALFSCIYEKGWQFSTASDMSGKEGYFVIDLCAYKEGRLTAASYFECRKEGALPFKMAYASTFTPESALSDAIQRLETLRKGGSVP